MLNLMALLTLRIQGTHLSHELLSPNVKRKNLHSKMNPVARQAVLTLFVVPLVCPLLHHPVVVIIYAIVIGPHPTTKEKENDIGIAMATPDTDPTSNGPLPLLSRPVLSRFSTLADPTPTLILIFV
jgi:hypothetical protein